jgi:hypothetical protein
VRDDFSAQTIDRLAKRAGNVCSNPDCRRPTFGSAKSHDGFVNVGVASHITAAAPGGPRYDPNLTSEQRRQQSNGIWLCQTHGKAVDSDEGHFTVEMLRDWKRLTEERSFASIVLTDKAQEQTISATVLEDGDDTSTAAHLLLAAKNDLDAFKRIPGWPQHPIELGLKMTRGENSQAFHASALANAIVAFNEIVLIAAPGTGKTTTLLQVTEAILSRGNSVALFIPLSEWSSQSDSLLASIARRHAFLGIGEDHLIQQARQGRLVLLLDGWNELDSASRQRARSEIQRLQRDFPGLGVVISTRRQALDVPISGPVAEVDPLSEHQQMEIARSLRGTQGEALLDHAWRTPGIRGLVSIPLYLTALLAHAEGERLPTSKEGVLRLFVTEHERDSDNAEVLRREMFGFHSELLRALAVEAIRLGTTTLSDSQARAAIKREEGRLISEGQINGLPQPTTLLDLLVSHHLLIRSGRNSGGLSFQHQQFQEWYGSFDVEDLMRKAAAGDKDSKLNLRLGPLNTRAWEESVLFACERVSRADESGSRAVSAAILETIGIDPMLAAEMIYRSAASVWETVRGQVVEFSERWHKSETVDRAVQFMITTGKPDFSSKIWPLISNENDQICLAAFRAAHRFRPSVLGTDIEQRVALLPEKERAAIASQIAFESGIEGIETAASIAIRDNSPKVKISVIEALDFRRADRFTVDVLRSAPDEVWSAVAQHSYLVVTGDGEIAERLVKERSRFIESEIDPLRKLNAIVEAGRRGQRVGDAAAALIESHDFPAMDQHVGWGLSEAYKVFPSEVKAALLGRLRAGLAIPTQAEDLLRTEDIRIDDGPVVAFTLDENQSESIVHGSLGVLGPQTVGRLIDKLIAVKGSASNTGVPEIKATHDLRDRIAATQPSSFVKAILERASTTVPSEIELLADLVSRHGNRVEGELLQIPSDLRTDFSAALMRWGEELLASSAPDRSHLAEVAMAIGRVSQPELGPVLGRMLAADLALRRDARQKMKTALEKRKAVDTVVRSSAQTGHSPQYRHAFANTGGEQVVELMKSYLPHLGFDGFGVDAAHVLRDLWEKEHNPPDPRRLVFGTDFSQVGTRRTERASATGAPKTSPYADAIFAVVDDFVKPGSSDEEHRHALQLATVALRMPHGDRTSTLDSLLQLKQSLREKLALLSALVLSGELVRADIVLDGLRVLVAERKAKRWFNPKEDWWELGVWLELLPFSDRPMATLDGLDLIDPTWRQPWQLRGILSALSYAPSSEAEHVLKELPRRDTAFLNDHDWLGALERRSPVTAARTLLGFISDGTLSAVEVRDKWWLTRKLGRAMLEDADFRADVYRQYDSASDGLASELLEGAIAEGADETGVLALVLNHAHRGEPYSGSIEAAIRHAVVGERPSQDWAGASELFGIAVLSLRKTLFGMIQGDTPEAQLAWRCLTRIDELRDEYGPVESEPRHPDIESGRPWPIPFAQ